ncbi:MAG TPA: hypothetical protein VNJ07_02685, partial [Chitinophagales bacterium]|nr:hypothetical protein [Chitinophagales bacterium]
MKSRIMLVLGGMGVLLLPPPSHSQSIDKKSFCKDIHMIVTAFSQHTDSLKGKFIGENSLGIRQWDARYCLPGAIAKFYEHTLLESNEEYRATYIMTQDVQQKEAEELYK